MKQLIGDLKCRVEQTAGRGDEATLCEYSAAVRDLAIAMYLYTRMGKSPKKIDEEAENVAGRHPPDQPAKKKAKPELPPGALLFLGLLGGIGCILLGALLGLLLDGLFLGLTGG